MRTTARLATAAAVALALTLTACGGDDGTDVPDPTLDDFAAQVVVINAHPGMNCYLHWVGFYTTDCYGRGIRPPYSVRIYAPRLLLPRAAAAPDELRHAEARRHRQEAEEEYGDWGPHEDGRRIRPVHAEAPARSAPGRAEARSPCGEAALSRLPTGAVDDPRAMHCNMDIRAVE